MSLSLFAFSQNSQKKDAFIPGLKGTGDKNDAILLNNRKDLDTLSYFVRQSQRNNCKGRFFKLQNEIVFKDSINFVPIGGRNSNNQADSNYVFSGNFDGNYKTISGFIINDNQNYTGFFGYIKNAEIAHVIIKDATVKGNDYCAVLCGFCGEGSLLHTSSVRMSMIDANNYVGTVLGYLSLNSTLRGCKYTGCNIFGKQNVGDICGYSERANKMADDKLNELKIKGNL
jgi:hypothetical protein